MNFCNPERISYRYQLKGYDHDWHYAGKNRLASYENFLILTVALMILLDQHQYVVDIWIYIK